MSFFLVICRNIYMDFKGSQNVIFEKMIRLTIYGAVFFVPLFFIPLSMRFFEFSKVVLFCILVLLGLIFWLIKIILSKHINWHINFFDLPFILIFLVFLLSSIFSIDKYNSFLGLNLMVSGAFFTFFFLFLFYFLVSRFINKIKEAKIIFYLFIFSSLIIILIKSLHNFFPELSLFALAVPTNTFYVLPILAFILTIILFLISRRKFIKRLNLILSIIFLFFIVLIDHQQLLLILAILIFFFILLLALKPNYFSDKLVITLTSLLFIIVIVLILPISNYTGLVSPKQFELPVSLGWEITKSSLAHNLLLGVGPQNFSYSFYAYKPLQYNQTGYWQLGFEKNSNFWLEIINNFGLIFFLIASVLFFKYLYNFFIFLKNIDLSSYYNKFIVSIGNCLILTACIILGCFYNLDFVLTFIFILFAALGVSFLRLEKPAKIINNKILINFGVYCCFIIILVFVYFGVKIVAAETYLEQVFSSSYASLSDFEAAESKIDKAIFYNPYNQDYNLKLSSFLLNKLILSKESGQEFDENFLLESIFENIDLAIIKDNKRIGYYLLLNEILNTLKYQGYEAPNYQSLINKKLVDLDPNNPELYIDRALINFEEYLSARDTQQQSSDQDNLNQHLLNRVKADLEKSIELKSDYLLGYYNLSLYWQELGDEEKALENMVQAYNLDPTQKIIVLNLKKLYLNQDKVIEAINILNEYLEFAPDDGEVRQELSQLIEL